MGLTYATVHLTNLINDQSMEINALVDTGATFLCVTEEIALQLGFDLTEARQQVVTLADGHQYKVPKIAPIEVAFGNRSYVTEAVVIGDESLLGALPLEAMDLVVDPRQQRLIANPKHPNYPVALAKKARRQGARNTNWGRRWK
ncbi:MAG: clan AA aspartic protease [Candidatus Thiosymbion ectosymbiont of Robbea hypermnestra]|nr:clan AA aspartic protease [Candidatus Thiosymbion ectosymbiont of Robbea hypermnestra]